MLKGFCIYARCLHDAPRVAGLRVLESKKMGQGCQVIPFEAKGADLGRIDTLSYLLLKQSWIPIMPPLLSTEAPSGRSWQPCDPLG